MKHTHIPALTLAIYGAASAYAQITLNPVPERVIGTPALTVSSLTPNLVEGREFYAPQSVALDTSVSPPILYVSDYLNNRVLGWKNSATFTTGQKADLVVGQPDLFTTFPEGPGSATSTYSTGLTRPSGLAVDRNGNLYVVDAGNNRVLRYPKPFGQTGQFPIPDLWLGQGTVVGHNANYPTGKINPQGLFLSTGSSSAISSLTFDSSGNLWVLDSGNLRVLRFNAADLAGTGGDLSADVVLGQPDLSSAQNPLSATDINSYYKLNQLIAPVSLAFDPNGNLFVADFNRGLVFVPPFSNGMPASPHLLGVFPQNYVYPTSPADKQALIDKTAIYAPSAFFFLSGGASGVGVVDAAYNRIMIFDTFANWPADGTPPPARTILGQLGTCTQSPNQTCKAANNGKPLASDSTFFAPAGAAYTGTELFLADSGNNRVLDLPQQGATFGPASRVLGQSTPNSNAPNLIEGREFNFQGTIGTSSFSDAAMAVDTYSTVPHLYVADPYNNRILGFKDLRKFQNGGQNKADIVLGQPDFATNLVNYPSGDPNKPTAAGLYRPIGLTVDQQGNLYVADSLNGRVLRFPAPFAYTGAVPEAADLVLGQQSFTSKIPDPTSATMGTPYGVALTPSCNVLTLPCPATTGIVVSDQVDNRVLYIPMSKGAFVAGTDNGKPATVVFGQTGFNSIGPGTSLTSLSNPHHLSCDTNGNVYVADSGNNRVLIFPDPSSPNTAASGQQAVSINGLTTPEGVFANPVTGEIWVANTGAGNFLRYASQQAAQLGQSLGDPIADTSGNFRFHPLAVIQDQYSDLFGADDAHRVTLFFPGMTVENGFSYAPTTSRPLSPGSFALVKSCGPCSPNQFVAPYLTFSTYPVPKMLGDVQVLVDGVASPLYFVSGFQINFLVPSSARTSGTADVQVVQVSTGQVLGAAQVPMASFSPGAANSPLVPWDGSKVFYVAAINEDGTVNGPNNPAIRGKFISLYMTGEGVVPGAPDDGVQPAAQPTPYTPNVVLNGIPLSPANVLYSGLNGLPGVWQLNVSIPTTTVPVSGAVWFAVITPDLQPNWNSSSGYLTYFYVK